MSRVATRDALELALSVITPALLTAWENVAFPPPTDSVTPWQKAFVLFATPENVEVGSGYNEIGYMQVTLMYPLQVGSNAAETRAQLIRSTFKKKNSYTSAGVVVTIQKTPEIGNGMPDGDRWAVTVKVPFMAQVYT